MYILVFWNFHLQEETPPHDGDFLHPEVVTLAPLAVLTGITGRLSTMTRLLTGSQRLDLFM
jgi:hypothetical protein